MTSTGPRSAAVRGVHTAVATWPRRVGLGAVVALVGLLAGTTAAGGFARHAATAPGPEQAAAGSVVETGPFDLEVRSWTVTAAHDPDGLAGLGADAWLVVVVHALDVDRESRRLDPAAVTLPDELPAGLALADDAEPDQPERTVLVRDASSYPVLHPGLAEDVALLWPVVGTVPAGAATVDDHATDAATPDEALAVAVPRYVYRDMTIGGGRRWAETGAVVRVDVPPGALPASLVEPAPDDPFAEATS